MTTYPDEWEYPEFDFDELDEDDDEYLAWIEQQDYNDWVTQGEINEATVD